jgi:hypothetical protein
MSFELCCKIRKYLLCPIIQHYGHGLAKKDDFRGITAKNADQKRFFSNFVGLAPYP